MNVWPQVDNLRNGDAVDAETLNVPVGQLASRTDYLKERLGIISKNGLMSSVVLTNVSISDDPAYAPEVGQVVYFHSDDNVKEFRKAQATMSLYDDFTASDSSFTVGILRDKLDSKTGNVLVYGQFNLGAYPGIRERMIQSGEAFRSGRYYLSAIEAGKLTSNPNGPLIYVGTFQSNGNDGQEFTQASVAYINPQFLDIGTSHVHRAYALMARPAGVLDGTEVIGYLPLGPDTALSSGSQDSSDASIRLPSLVFGGTWTSTNDVSYRFALSRSGAWGEATLKWWRNGIWTSAREKQIPAPGVFIDLEDGLKVKVICPETTKSNSEAYPDYGAELKWAELMFPHAGKGWVNHAVEAVATDGSDSLVRALVSGSWRSENINVFIPRSVYTKDYSATGIGERTSVTLGETVYTFRKYPAEETDVQLAATVEESLSNLAKKTNTDEIRVLYDDKMLVVSGTTFTGEGVNYIEGAQVAFEVIGGMIPLLVCFDETHRLIGGISTSCPCFVPQAFGDVDVTLYVSGTTASNGITCEPDTCLTASAYDYCPDAGYDYVMGLHQEVDYYFPPVPAKSAGLFVNGVEVEGADLFPNNPTYTIGRKTIYWMEDDADHLPWPYGISGHDDPVLPKDDKTMAFYFNVGFQCATGPVTSLVPAPGSPVKLYTHGTNDPAYTGDLMVDLAIDLSVSDNGIPGYKVAKQGRGGKLLAGAVVERIKAGPGLVVTQQKGCPMGQGTVTVALDNGSLNGSFTEIALENAKQEKIGLFPYVSLLGWGESENIPSAFTAMMRVPTTLDADLAYRLKVKAVVFGAAPYEATKRQAAGLLFEYNILPDYTGDEHLSLKTGLLVPDSQRRIALPLGHEDSPGHWTYTAYDPFVVTTNDDERTVDDVHVRALGNPLPDSAEFSSSIGGLKPGYLVAIRLSRMANPDTVSYDNYPSALGFMSLEWELSED